VKSQVLIASYEKDFIWLIHCLGSLKRFSKGFLHPVVCVEEKDVKGCQEVVDRAYPETKIVVKNGRPGQGFMRAQCAMMSADILCPEADFIFLLGSDTIAADTFSPEPYFSPEGKPVMLYTTYDDLNVPGHSNAMPWRKGTERVVGWEPHAEFMRRLPVVYDRDTFRAFRMFVTERHRMAFEDYIYESDKKHGYTSESNCLGAFAWKYEPESYHWVNTTEAGVENGEVRGWPSPIRQFWSHGGFDRITEANFTFGDGKSSKGRTPREIIDEILYFIPAK
jgi:hypothetical protein